MDPLSQAVVGGACALALAPGTDTADDAAGRPRFPMGTAALLGALSGMAPDLDVLIFSRHDPLLFLEYHRQFTHALAFIPLGALLCAALSIVVLRHGLPFRVAYLYCLLGYGSHGLLDACTSYGTQLLWPFSDFRVAWNNVSVVDPAFTIPVLVLLAAAVLRNQRGLARLAFAFGLAYLLTGVVQRERAVAAGGELARQRGHVSAGKSPAIDAKPAFGSLLLWKTIYLHGDYFYIDAVRTGSELKSYPGERALRLSVERDLAWLDRESQQARDLERFRWFSSDALALHPDDPSRVIDVRYSMVPNQIDPLWGIVMDREAELSDHVEFFSMRKLAPGMRETLFSMIRGGDLVAR